MEDRGCLSKHGPISFWFLNHDLEDDELIWQMDQMKDKGFRGVMIHPRDGLLVPYLSELWFDKVKLIIDHCRSIGLQAWLYDEDPFPSGDAGGKIAMEHPELRPRVLDMYRSDTSGGRIRFDFGAGKLLKVQAYARDATGRLHGVPLDLTAHAGTIRMDWEPVSERFATYYLPYEDYGSKHWRTRTDKPSFRVDAVLPEGEWTIAAFVVRTLDFYVDLLNPSTTETFIRLTHDQYASRFGSHFGQSIPGMFTDEPQLMGHHPWTDKFPEFFEFQYGYDILNDLLHLFTTVDNRTPQIRQDYRFALSRLFQHAYIEPIAKWCAEHGLASSGHISPEEDPVGQTYKAPYLLSQLKKLDIPGTDLITDLTGSRQFPLLHLGPKMASSAAHLQGGTLASAEAYGANSWSLSLADMKSKADWLFALGINELITHGQYYSIDGRRKQEAPPSLFYQSGLWDFYETWSRYIADRTGKLKEGTHRCPILLYYPQPSFDALLPDRFKEADQLRDSFGKLVHLLLSNQWDFDLVDKESLLEMTIDQGKWKGKTERYDLLIMPFTYLMEQDLLDLCSMAQQAGALVWDAGEHAVYGSAVSLDELVPRLNTSIQRSYRLYGEQGQDMDEVYVLERKLEGKIRLFLVNALDVWRTGTVAFTDCECMERFLLPPSGSLMLDFDLASSTIEWHHERDSAHVELAYLMEQRKPFADKQVIADNWTVTACADNVYVCSDFFPWRTHSTETITGITNHAPFNVMKNAGEFHGPARLFSRFFTSGSSSRIMLVYEQSAWEGMAEIYVNGSLVDEFKRCRRFDTNNYEADVTPFLTSMEPGRSSLNWLEVRFPQGGILREPLRLYGDFTVTDAEAGNLLFDPVIKPVSYGKGFRELGYPHYSGQLSYRRHVEVPAHWFGHESEQPKAPIYLHAERIRDAAVVFINGAELPKIVMEPFLWEVTDYVKPNDNKFEIRVGNHPGALLEGAENDAGIFGEISLILDNEVRLPPVLNRK